jgi:hypothetical protein
LRTWLPINIANFSKSPSSTIPELHKITVKHVLHDLLVEWSELIVLILLGCELVAEADDQLVLLSLLRCLSEVAV